MASSTKRKKKNVEKERKVEEENNNNKAVDENNNQNNNKDDQLHLLPHEIDHKAKRRQFLKEQLVKINKSYSSDWQRRMMATVAGIEAKLRFRKVPILDEISVPGTIYVGDRKFSGKSFFYFGVDHALRKFAIRVITDPWYMNFSTVLLLIHMVPVLVAEPGVPRHRFADFLPEFTSWFLLLFDRILLLYFTTELGITFLAYGCLRTLGNWFRLVDVFAVVIGIIVDSIPYDLNEGRTAKYFIALNSVRVFRIVGRVEGMRKLMMVLVSCIPTLLNVAMLLGTLFFAFAIIGLTFFRSATHNRCVSADFSSITHSCTPGAPTFRPGQRCETGFNCTEGVDAAVKWGNFDNFGPAIFVINQVFMLDDWYVIASQVMDGSNAFTFLFFLVAVVVGAFWAMNLILAVVTDSFSRFYNNEKFLKLRKQQQKKEERELDQLLSGGGDDTTNNNGKEGTSSLTKEKLEQNAIIKAKNQEGDNNNNKEDDMIDLRSDQNNDPNNINRGVGFSNQSVGGGSSGFDGMFGEENGGAGDIDPDNIEYNDEGDPILTTGHIKGTHPWFKRKLQMWIRNLSNASTASILAGIRTIDVKSLIDAEGGTVREHYSTFLDHGDNNEKHLRSYARRNNNVHHPHHHHHHHHNQHDDEDSEELDTIPSSDNDSNADKKNKKDSGDYVINDLSLALLEHQHEGDEPYLVLQKRNKKKQKSKQQQQQQNLIPSSSSPARNISSHHQQQHQKTTTTTSNINNINQWSSTGLFDDSDLVNLAANANISAAQHVSRNKKQQKQQQSQQQPQQNITMMAPAGARRTAVAQRMNSIETWTKTMPKSDELTTIPDEEPLWDIEEDEMFDPMLSVPEASDPVGTRGKHFYPKSMFRPLNLFERYDLAAKRAEEGVIPEDQESEDDIDMGFVDQNSMSLANVRRRLQKTKLRAAATAALATRKMKNKIKNINISGGLATTSDINDSSSSSSSDDDDDKKNKKSKNKEGYGSIRHLKRNSRKIVMGKIVGGSGDEESSAAGKKKTKKQKTPGIREQLLDWIDTIHASYNSVPFNVLVRMIHESAFVQRLINWSIILTAGFLSANFHKAPKELITAIDFFTGLNDLILVLDTLVILYFLGWFSRGVERQAVSAATAIDIIVGGMGMLDLVLVVPGFFRALRGIRGVRLIKLAKNFTLLHEMIAKLRASFYYFFNLLAVAICFVLVFATIGRHVFDGWLPQVMNCFLQKYDFNCNIIPDCVFVTHEEWMNVSHTNTYYEEYQTRSFLPLALNETTATELDVYASNSTLLAETPIVAAYFNSIQNYSCRQFRNWGETGAPGNRLTFNSPVDAFVTVFNILTRNSFSNVMYQFMDVNPWSCLLFLFVLVIGSFLLIALLMSILLVYFGDLDVEVGGGENGENANNPNNELDNMLQIETSAEEAAEKERIRKLKIKEQQERGDEEPEEDPETWESRPSIGGVTHPPSAIASRKVPMEPIPDDASIFTKVGIYLRFFAHWILFLFCDVHDPLIHKENLQGKSFFMFSAESTFRLKCCDFISGKWFPYEETVAFCSMVHCVTTFIIGDQSFDNAEGMATILTIDWLLVGFSIVDLLARCIAQGAYFGKYSFWNTRYENKLDAFTILCSLCSAIWEVSVQNANIGFAPDMFLRAFRPIRIIIRSRGMKNVALAVWKTMPAMAKVIGLASALIWMLAIMCVSYFSGVLQVCSDGSDRAESECFGVFETSRFQLINGEQQQFLFNETREYRNPNEFNFDNIFYAFSTLVQIAVASQWTNAVFPMVDSPLDAGDRPIRDQRYWTVFLIIIWVIVGNFVILNIFVGTIVDNFARFKLRLAGALFKTKDEIELMQIQTMLKQTRVKKALSVPETPFINHLLNKLCYTVATSTPFLYWTRVVTLFDMISIATLHYNQSDNWMQFQEAACRAISIALWLEVFLKVGISGPVPYIKLWFNRIDFTMACVVGAESLTYIFWDDYRTYPFLHTARIVSSFRLVREVKSFRSLLKSGLRALPAMSNIGALVSFVFFMTSFVGMAFFQSVRTIIDSSANAGINLDYDVNFQTIPRAVIAMLTVATLDNWGDILQAAGAEPPNCQAGVDCGSPVIANIFFVSFVIFVGFIMINMFITVVLENFSESVLVPAYITERLRDVNSFRQLWVTFDPAGRQVIGAQQFVELLNKLPGPRFRLGRLRGDIEAGDNVSECSWNSVDKERYAAHSAVGLMGEPQAAVLPTLKDLCVPITMPRQEVLFADALDVVGEKIFHISLLDATSEAVRKETRRQAREYDSGYEIVHYYAASKIQKFVRESWARAELPPQIYKSTILWDQILKPLFVERWKHNAETIYKSETAEEASTYRKLTLSRIERVGAKEDDDDGGKSGRKRSTSAARRRAESVARNRERSQANSSSNNANSPTTSKGGGGGESDNNKKQQEQHIKPLLHMKNALGSIMTEVEEEVEEDLSWKDSVWEVDSDGSSWADDEGEEAWLPASAISGERTIRSVSVAPECRRHGGVYELVSVAELIARKKREREFLSNFLPSVRHTLQTMPPRTRTKFHPALQPNSSELVEFVEQSTTLQRSKGQQQQFRSMLSPSTGIIGGSPTNAEASTMSSVGRGRSDNFDTSPAAVGLIFEVDDEEEVDGEENNTNNNTSSASVAAAAKSVDNLRTRKVVYLADLEVKKKGQYYEEQEKVRQLRLQQQQKAKKFYGGGTSSSTADYKKLSASASASPTSESSKSKSRQEKNQFRYLLEQQQQKYLNQLSGGQQDSQNYYQQQQQNTSGSLLRAPSSIDMDDALVELEQRFVQDRLKSVSRLSSVSQIRSVAATNRNVNDTISHRQKSAAAAASIRGTTSALDFEDLDQDEDEEENRNSLLQSNINNNRNFNSLSTFAAMFPNSPSSTSKNNQQRNLLQQQSQTDDFDESPHHHHGADPSSSSVAGLRRAVFDPTNVRTFSATNTAGLIAATEEAAAPISFGNLTSRKRRKKKKKEQEQEGFSIGGFKRKVDSLDNLLIDDTNVEDDSSSDDDLSTDGSDKNSHEDNNDDENNSSDSENNNNNTTTVVDIPGSPSSSSTTSKKKKTQSNNDNNAYDYKPLAQPVVGATSTLASSIFGSRDSKQQKQQLKQDAEKSGKSVKFRHDGNIFGEEQGEEEREEDNKNENKTSSRKK